MIVRPVKADDDLIRKILAATGFEDLVSVGCWKEDYKRMMALVHPDVCSLPGASAAATRLNELKDRFEKGMCFSDESGNFYFRGNRTVFNGNTGLLKRSLINYEVLKAAASSHLAKYLPAGIYWEQNELVVVHGHRAVPISGLRLPQQHVNWILSRLLEFSALMDKIGMVHCGLTPENVFIVPETHGIEVTSFYHMTSRGRKVSTINAQYRNWYPSQLFRDKTAAAYIDIELSKKNAIYLLGDASGNGVRLKKNFNAGFMDFVIKQSFDPGITYDEYRSILKRNFKSEFHILHL